MSQTQHGTWWPRDVRWSRQWRRVRRQRSIKHRECWLSHVGWGSAVRDNRHSIQPTWHEKQWPSSVGWSKAMKGDKPTTLDMMWGMVGWFCGVGQRGKERQEDNTRLWRSRKPGFGQADLVGSAWWSDSLLYVSGAPCKSLETHKDWEFICGKKKKKTQVVRRKLRRGESWAPQANKGWMRGNIPKEYCNGEGRWLNMKSQCHTATIEVPRKKN